MLWPSALNPASYHLMSNLEEHIAHMQRMLDDLSDVVAAQEKEISRLKARVAMLMEREAQREADGSGAAHFGDERPPHY